MRTYRAKLTGNIGKNWMCIEAGETLTWDGQRVSVTRVIRERGEEKSITLSCEYAGRLPLWWELISDSEAPGDGAAAEAAAPTLDDLGDARKRSSAATEAARLQREAKAGGPPVTGPATAAAKLQRAAKAGD